MNNLTKKELYTQYWRCRDFELSSLWQKSIFLSAFMLLCLTGYGMFFTSIFSSSSFNGFRGVKAIDINIVSLCIGSLGLVFSTLWILLSKSSKAWYEVYERSIASIELDDSDFMPYENIGGFKVENLSKYKTGESPIFNQRLFSSNGGGFSPSRINIAIGHVLFVIWALIMSLHISCILDAYKLTYASLPNWIFIGIIVLLVSFSLKIICPKNILKDSMLSWWLGSSSLADKDPGNK